MLGHATRHAPHLLRRLEEIATPQKHIHENATDGMHAGDFTKLCDYIRFTLLGHSKGTRCPKYLVMRLKGFARGQYIANAGAEMQPELYSYHTLYCTCLYCKDKILGYFHNNQNKIKDEQHKINLILSFMEQEVGGIHQKLKTGKAQQQRLANTALPQQANTAAAYTPKSKINNRLKNLL